MTTNLVFDPLLPLWALGVLGALGLIAAALSWRIRLRAGLARAFGVAALVLAAANPSVVEEDREGLSDIALVVVDESASMRIAARDARAEAALARLETLAANDPTLDLKVVRGGRDGEGTRLFSTLERALSDVPVDRFAGAVMITDGRIHDAPDEIRSLAERAPFHALLTGESDESDRRITLVAAPGFGIVGKTSTFSVRMDDAAGLTAILEITVDGEVIERRPVIAGRETEVEVPVDHAGVSVVEFAVEPGARELTLDNNRVAVGLTGVRDRLRVLLISGEPHAGERTWRDLLKADPSVDLVHFTILRPLEKVNTTPSSELALIEFPYRELFEQKLEEFDLVIFDRYRRRGVIRSGHLGLVTRYVENGGAVLVAAGPPFGSVSQSLYRTPLAAVLPARPTGRIIEGGFQPRLTTLGARHPLTGELTGANDPSDAEDDPSWGRWFRLVEATALSGQVLMTGPEDRPLLVTDRVGEGRVAQFLSDHAWLWARGYEGGGPQAEMLRRLSHWLMSEPELEEEAVILETGREGELVVERRTLADAPPAVTLTDPEGGEREVALIEDKPGLWRGSVPAPDRGLWRARSGDLATVGAVGAIDDLESGDVTSTEQRVAPIVEESGGRIVRLADAADGEALRIRRASRGALNGGSGSLLLQENGAYRVKSTEESPALPFWLGLLVILGAFALAWRWEGR